MESDLQVLQAGPDVVPRRETVPVPEFGGAVVVRGLLASEAFAIESLRGQALRRLRTEQAEARQAYEEHIAGIKDPAKVPPYTPPDVELTFEELREYGRYVAQMLALAVMGANDMGLYTRDQWELVNQAHPGVVDRLQAVAERLSGMNVEDVRKNSTSSPS